MLATSGLNLFIEGFHPARLLHRRLLLIDIDAAGL